MGIKYILTQLVAVTVKIIYIIIVKKYETRRWYDIIFNRVNCVKNHHVYIQL